MPCAAGGLPLIFMVRATVSTHFSRLLPIRKICLVFNLFGKAKRNSSFTPPRAPGETIRPDDADYLRNWVSGRAFVEGYVCLLYTSDAADE